MAAVTGFCGVRLGRPKKKENRIGQKLGASLTQQVLAVKGNITSTARASVATDGVPVDANGDGIVIDSGTVNDYASGVPVTTVYQGKQCAVVDPARSNLAFQSDQHDTAPWAESGGTATNDTTAGPDGTTNADTLDPNSAAGIPATQVIPQVSINQSVRLWMSTYAKQLDSGAGFRMRIGDSGGGATNTEFDAADMSLTAYKRFQAVENGNASDTTAGVARFLGHSTQAGGAGTAEIAAWGTQWEMSDASYDCPTSLIPTTVAAVARPDTIIKWDDGEYGDWMHDQTWEIDFWPFWDHDEGLSATIILIGWQTSGAVDKVELRWKGTEDKFEIRDNDGTIAVQSGAMTFNKGDQLTLTCSPSQGALKVAGGATGDSTETGTVWSGEAADLGWGSRIDEGLCACGIVSEPRIPFELKG